MLYSLCALLKMYHWCNSGRLSDSLVLFSRLDVPSFMVNEELRYSSYDSCIRFTICQTVTSIY